MQPEAAPSPGRPFPPGAWALIFGLILACYWPALGGGLLWDDPAHVTRPDLQSLRGLVRIWTDLHATQQYYPVLHSAFWIEHRLWGDATIGYHLINIFWHGLACGLLVLVLRKLRRPGTGSSPPPAIPAGTEWLAAAIFAVHPVCVESVAWISEQKNTLSLVFYLLAALNFLEFEASRAPRPYGRALIFFLLALGTKSVTATLPPALLVLVWWRNGGLSWRRDVAPLLPWFAAALVAGLFTAWVERKFIGAEGAAFDLTPGQHVLLASRIAWFYLGKLFWPAHLVFIYPRWEVAAMPAVTWLGPIGLAGATVAFWAARRTRRGVFAGWMFFLGSLFPALGFVNVYPFLFSYVADHFQYLACLGVIVPVAAGLARLAQAASSSLRHGARIAGGAVVILLAFAASRQSHSYRDAVTLYRTTLADNPASWMAQNNLGVELVKEPGHVNEALAHYEEALRLKPDYAEAHNNYGTALATLPGRAQDAAAHFALALQLQPNFAEAHVNLGNLLVEVPGREPEAVNHYEQALRLGPDLAEVHYALANAFGRLPGREPEAEAQFQKALQLNPHLAEAHVNYANLLARLPGRMPDALAHFAQALQFKPGLVKGHYDLAVLLSTLPGREAESIFQYEETLRLKPDYAKAHNNLAVAYARAGRLDEARQHWERALDLDPGYVEPRRNLELLRRLRKQ